MGTSWHEDKIIVTSFIYPPIPLRNYDWIAYVEGDEEGARGWGASEDEAKADLIEQLEEHEL